MSHFKMYKKENGCYSLIFKVNKSIDFYGIDYTKRSCCFKAIKLIKYLSSQKKAYKIEKVECGSWLFKIINIASGEIIGQSKTCLNNGILQKNIINFKKALPKSKTDLEVYSL